MMSTRRDFIKDTCTACLGTAFLGFSFSQLTSCASLPVYKTTLTSDTVTVPLTSFAASNLLVVRDMQVPYDILIVKKSETEFLSLYMKCTHQENPLTATADGLYCSSHGSRFALNGKVTKEPALEPLKRFKTEINNDSLIVYLNS